MSDIWKTEYHIIHTEDDEAIAWLDENQRVEAIERTKKLTEEGTPHHVICAEYYNTEYTTIWEPDEDQT